MIDLHNLTVEDVDLLGMEQVEEALALKKENGKKLYFHLGKVGKALWARKKGDPTQAVKVPEIPAKLEIAPPVELPPASPEYVSLSPQAFCEKVLIQMAASGARHSSVKRLYTDVRRAYQGYTVIVDTLRQTGGEMPQFSTLGRDDDTGEILEVAAPTPPPLVPDLSEPAPAAPTGEMSRTDLINQLREERAGQSGPIQFEGQNGFTEVEPVVMGQQG